ncbi:hypothetical protein ACFSC6_04295 [Rufibacter sediminis]|uniref:YtxH domain-containing protein n=1 Tax=Rufibacter sediminis TaxID=2762756 RepID=A0ABR6VSB6_9BACT|nr:hypothetical protein [Rufibacter sediminis]MBC3540057.1 hypothetical protein [Rufibacter sediminis]
MAKNKNKKNKEAKGTKNKSLLSGVKSLTKNKKVLYSLLGAAGAGIAIAALGKDKRRSLTDSVTNSVKGLGSSLGVGATGASSDTSANNQ